MKRFPDWPVRLHLLIASSKEITFDWGRYNCGLFVARWIREATGVDVGAAYMGVATDEASADAIFLAGFTDLGAFAASIAAAYGMPEILPNFAQRGDAVWVDNDTAYGALGIVGTDPRFAICMGPEGTKRVHSHRWRRAWKV
jgi:hypothetical protein